MELVDFGSTGDHVGDKGLEILAEHFGCSFGVNCDKAYDELEWQWSHYNWVYSDGCTFTIITLFCAPLVLLCVPFLPHFLQMVLRSDSEICSHWVRMSKGVVIPEEVIQNLVMLWFPLDHPISFSWKVSSWMKTTRWLACKWKGDLRAHPPFSCKAFPPLVE